MKLRAMAMSAAAVIALTGYAHADVWYMGISAGQSYISDADVGFDFGNPPAIGPLDQIATFDAGWAVSASIGTHVNSNLRVELEVMRRQNDMSLLAHAVVRSGEMVETTLMANVLYDFKITSKITGSVGAGVGADFSIVDDGAVIDETDLGVAFQGIAGLSYPITGSTDLTLTYRYLVANGPQVTGVHTSAGHVDAETFDDLSKQSISVGLRFRIEG